MKTALIIDSNNVYLEINKKFPGQVLSYTNLLESLESQEYNLLHKVAYGRQPEEKVRGFATMMKKNGFEIFFGNTPHNIQMALKVADLIHTAKIECLILGTNYFEAGRILQYARSQGVQTKCLGVNIPEFFAGFCDVWEMDEAYFQEKKAPVINTETGSDETAAAA